MFRPVLLRRKLTPTRELLHRPELMFQMRQRVVFENSHCCFRKRRPSHLQIEVFEGHGVFFQEVQRVLGNKTHPEEAAAVM